MRLSCKSKHNNSFNPVTAEFYSVAHYHRHCSFIGEEVGDGYYGSTSGYDLRLTLPHTKIRVTIPLWE